jgi:Tol biopolymer transport system component
MIEQRSKPQHKGNTCRAIRHMPLELLTLVVPMALALLLAACGAPSSAPVEVVAQTALPTPTLEPTFTASAPPTSPAIPSPTATPVEPTPTPSPQTALSGHILDQGTNQPIVGAEVRVGAVTATTDPEGRYTLTGLPPGQYVLSVTHPDYDPGLSSIFTLGDGQELSLDLVLYAPDTSPYPKDPMLTNPLDPSGAPTVEDAERLARLQGLAGEVVSIRETNLSSEYLVNYKIGDEVRAAIAELNHEVWELTDDADRKWWIIKVCGNLASPLRAEMVVATPRPQPLPPMAEVVVDELIVRACASEECAEVGTVERGAQVEVLGCLADGGWCQVDLPGGGSGWCMGRSLRQLAVAEAVLAVQAVLPTATPGVAAGEGKIAFLSTRDHLSEEYPHYELYLMNSDGSQQTRVTTAGLPPYSCFLSWMPDYSQLFYNDCSSWRAIINLLDGTIVPWHLPVSEVGSSVHFSPDGSRLAYEQVERLPFNIFVVNADGTDHRQLTFSPENVQAQCPSWSPNGDKLAFGVVGGRSSFWVMKADGSEKVKLADASARESAWSPSGDRIAFECYVPGTTKSAYLDICVINSDGTNLVSLTHFERHQAAWHPTWSPDAKQIAFYVETSSSTGRQEQVHVINADGTGLTQLTFEGNNCCPAWSR